MKKLHKLLKKQIAKHSDFTENLSKQQKSALKKFLNDINSTYQEHDRNNELLERSTSLSSEELFQANCELRLQSKEVQALYNILSLTQDHNFFEEMCLSILDVVAKTINFPAAAIELLDQKKQNLELICHLGIPNISSNTKLNDNFFSDIGMKTILKIPIQSEVQRWGNLWVASPIENQDSARVISWLDALSKQISSTIENKRLNEIMKEQDAQMAATAKMSELGKMAGEIAHEINTPLSAIHIMAEHLLECKDNPSSEIIVQNAESILKVVGRIAKIIRGLRTFSREGSAAPFETTNLYRLITDTAGLCHEKLKQRGITLSIQVPDYIEITCQVIQISQVILNLLNNSADAIENLNERWIKICAEDFNDKISISIIDSGHGISEENRNKLFVPFFTTKEVGKGTGLGLNVSAAIVKNHKGTLECDFSSPNTKFTIMLQKKRSTPKAA